MIRRFSINFALLSILFDALSVILGLWFAVYFRPSFNAILGVEVIPDPVFIPGLLYYIFPIMWMTVYSMLSIYDGRKYLRTVDELAALTIAMVIASISTAGILYFSYRDVSRFLFILFVVITYFISLFWRFIMRLYFRGQSLSTIRARKIIVVGAGGLGQKVRDEMMKADDSSNITFLGYIDDTSEFETNDPQFLGDLKEIRNIVHDKSVSDVVIALPYSKYDKLGSLVKQLEDVSVQIWIALGFFDLALYRTSIEDFEGIPMLDLRASAIDDYQRMAKRVFDLVCGSLAFLAALPLMMFSAMAIILDDGLPVLFHQKRVGENGRVFDMIKFRTMVRSAEQLQRLVEKRDGAGNIIPKSANDPRVTRVGRFLRRFSLDELPQLINVIRGDMSLVGPRPELPYLVERYQPWQRKRFSVPPGITGWWQVTGRSDKPMHLHTEDDLYYIQNYSIGLDILILIRTAWIVLLGKGAY